MTTHNEKNNMSLIDYWLWLTLKKSMSAEKIQSLLEYIPSPKEMYNMPKENLLKIKGISKKTASELADKSLAEVKTVKDQCRKYNIKIMTFDSPKYPENLKNIPAPPYVLYVRCSKPINLNEYIRIAVVGNRKSTPYGDDIAKNFAYNLANNGICIVSGMARGIDSSAHKGCIDAGGLTVAVMGCGLDMAYPKENKNLMAKIIETGMAISEYPPGAKPDNWHFPQRNRIISGLSQGTLIVEAPKRSGSLITARYALEQDRDLFAVPGDINTPRSEGPNNLLKECAIPVTSARDIFDYYTISNFEISKIKNLQKEKGINVSEDYKEQKKEDNIKVADINADFYKDLNDEEKHIISKLTSVPINFEQLLDATNLSADKLTSAITLLEIKGKIKSYPGKNFTLNI